MTSWIAGQARNDNTPWIPGQARNDNTPWIPGQARNDNTPWIAGQARNDNTPRIRVKPGMTGFETLIPLLQANTPAVSCILADTSPR
jgi:ribosomal protein S30